MYFGISFLAKRHKCGIPFAVTTFMAQFAYDGGLSFTNFEMRLE